MSQSVKSIIEITALSIAIIGLFMTYCQLQQNEKLARDTYLTGIWNDIIKESIKYPDFQDKSKTLDYKTAFSKQKRIEYETYTRWLGGFLEDLHYHDYKKEELWFFEPTLKTLLDTHCLWFKDHIEYYEFTQDFYEKIKKLECDSI